MQILLDKFDELVKLFITSCVAVGSGCRLLLLSLAGIELVDSGWSQLAPRRNRHRPYTCSRSTSPALAFKTQLATEQSTQHKKAERNASQLTTFKNSQKQFFSSFFWKRKQQSSTLELWLETEERERPRRWVYFRETRVYWFDKNNSSFFFTISDW